MRRKSLVSDADRSVIDTTLSDFIPSRQDNRLAVGIESEGKSPNTFIMSESKLLHVCEARSFKRADSVLSDLWAPIAGAPLLKPR
jgi:hypothetical protein